LGRLLYQIVCLTIFPIREIILVTAGHNHRSVAEYRFLGLGFGPSPVLTIVNGAVRSLHVHLMWINDSRLFF
jgi:hypothetical protein